MPPVFKAEEVEFTYGPLKVIDGLTLAVNESEIFGILGANGAGKTTLMRLLIGPPEAVLRRGPGVQGISLLSRHRPTRLHAQLSALYQELSARTSSPACTASPGQWSGGKPSTAP